MVRFLRYPRARDAFVHSRRHPAQSVIPTYALRRLSAFVTNATLALTADGASSVVTLVRLIPLRAAHLVGVRADITPPPLPLFSFAPTRCAISGISDAYYCAECTRLEKDRDGCPKIVNLGASRTDLFYERRRLGVSCHPWPFELC